MNYSDWRALRSIIDSIKFEDEGVLSVEYYRVVGEALVGIGEETMMLREAIQECAESFKECADALQGIESMCGETARET